MNYKILRPPLHDNFELPLREMLLSVKIGDLVKIMFQAGEGVAERMWVLVKKKQNDEEWEGTLDNDPVGEELKMVIKSGDAVTFHPYDIIQIHK